MKCRRVVVVILNYMNYRETEECTNSVLKQNYSNYHILIVDNGSNNESYLYLKRVYKGNPRVSVIKTGKNYGFAKGNNIGIHYAKNTLEAEYIMLLNSDTILTDLRYIRDMVEADEKGIGVIGSNILQRDSKNIRKIHRYVVFPGTLIYYLKIVAERNGFCQWQSVLEDRLLKCKGSYILQGCVLLLTPDYFSFYDDLDSRTFLYCEEELLYLRCEKVGLKEKLVEDISLFHKCGRSSQILYKNRSDIFYKYLLSSYKFVVWESFKIYMFGLK